MAWLGRHGEARRGKVGNGEAWYGRRGVASWVWLGWAGLGMAGLGSGRQGWVRLGLAGTGVVRQAWLGVLRNGSAWCGAAGNEERR